MINNPISLHEERIEKQSEFLSQNHIHVLQKFGLSKNQSKIYLCIIKFGAKPASEISKLLGIPRTETYHILKTLQMKGCAEIINHKPLKFGAVPIEDFLEKVITREKNKIQKLQDTIDLVKKLKVPPNQIDFNQLQ